MLLLIVAGTGMDGLVLCIMPDGQIALEKPSGLCCDDNSSSVRYSAEIPPKPVVANEDDHHCDCCVDIPFSESGLFCHSTTDLSAKLRLAKPFSSDSFTTASARYSAIEGRSSLPPPVTKTSLTSLRSVTLRI